MAFSCQCNLLPLPFQSIAAIDTVKCITKKFGFCISLFDNLEGHPDSLHILWNASNNWSLDIVDGLESFTDTLSMRCI